MAIDLKSFRPTKHKGVRVNKDHSKYLLVFEIDGKRYRRLFKANSNHGRADNLKAAFIAREKHIAKIKNQNPETEDLSARTVDDYFDIFLIGGKKGVRKPEVNKWLENYYKRNIQPIIGTMKVSDVKEMHINQIYDKIAHLALRTRKTSYEILKPLFDRAVSDGAIQKSPITDNHKIIRNQSKEKRKVKNAIQKYEALYKAIMEVYADNPHHRSLFLFGLAGRRKTETLKIRWQDIDFENHRYTIVAEHNKADEDMIYKMDEDLEAALLEFRDIEGQVFHITWISDAVKKIREASGIPEFTFHLFRNIVVSAFSTQGMNAVELSGLLGHTSPDTLRKYLDIQREEASKKAVSISKKLRNSIR